MNAEVLNLLIKYFETEVPLLKSSYKWKIPEIDGFDSSLESSFSANVKLKQYLNVLWAQSDKTDFEVAETIIKKWGGVKGNKSETIEAYIASIRENRFETPFKGLASYTKLYSIVEPKRFAIYDARVAVTLNALQCNANIKSGVAFNYLSGRNNITGNALNKRGFSQQREYSISNLVRKGWERVSRAYTYQLYLDYLFACKKHNPNWKLYELEMVLFANAEQEAMKSITGTQVVKSKTSNIISDKNNGGSAKISKLNNQDRLYDYVQKEPSSITKPFKYDDIIRLAMSVIPEASKAGINYASLRFLQKYCYSLNGNVEAIDEYKNLADPRKFSTLKELKSNWQFEIEYSSSV